MRKKLVVFILLAASVCFLNVGCAAPRTLSASSLAHYESLERLASNGESEIVITRPRAFTGSGVAMHVFLNDQKQDLDLVNGGAVTLVVPNGTHSICARNQLSRKNCRRNAIILNLTNERVIVNAGFNMWSMSFMAPVKLTNVGQFSLSNEY